MLAFDYSTELEGKFDNITLQSGWTVFNMEAIEFATDTMSGSNFAGASQARRWMDDVAQERDAIAVIV